MSTCVVVLARPTPSLPQSVQVLARNAATTWWKVSYSGQVGWLSAGYVTLQAGADLGRIPINLN